MRRTRFLALFLALCAALTLSGTATADTRASTESKPTLTKPTLRLPDPGGPFPVGTKDLHLVDHDRPDPWAPTPRPRELMAQVWYPAVPLGAHAEYGDSAAAEAYAKAATQLGHGRVDPFLHRVRPSARLNAPVLPGRWPVLLYSPGRGSLRSSTTAIAEGLAARGYLVVAVDHTFDAAVTRFPDGRVVAGNRPTRIDPPAIAAEVQVRVADIRFTLDQLSADPFRQHLDLSRVGVFGHSLGGDTAGETMRADSRFRVGANLDGAFWGEVPKKGVPGPFLLLSAGPTDHPGLADWRANQRAWGRHFQLPGGVHASATDIILFAEVSGLSELLKDRPELLRAMFGSVDPVHTTQLYRTYLAALFDRHLFGRPAPVLDRESPRWPEHKLIWSNGGAS